MKKLLFLMTLSMAFPAVAQECPSQDFKIFFKAYQDDLAVQQAFTQFPLEVRSLDKEAEPEPAEKTDWIESASSSLVPTLAEMETQKLTLSINEPLGNSAKVKIEKPDTDYQMIYHFQHGECWKLVRKDDHSL